MTNLKIHIVVTINRSAIVRTGFGFPLERSTTFIRASFSPFLTISELPLIKERAYDI